MKKAKHIVEGIEHRLGRLEDSGKHLPAGELWMENQARVDELQSLLDWILDPKKNDGERSR